MDNQIGNKPVGGDYRRCGSNYGEEYDYQPRPYAPPCLDQSSSSPYLSSIEVNLFPISITFPAKIPLRSNERSMVLRKRKSEKNKTVSFLRN